jgi:hypothetical protein
MSADPTAVTGPVCRRRAAPLMVAGLGVGLLLSVAVLPAPAQSLDDELFNPSPDAEATAFEPARSAPRRNVRARFGDIAAVPVTVAASTDSAESPVSGMGKTGFNSTNTANGRLRAGGGTANGAKTSVGTTPRRAVVTRNASKAPAAAISSAALSARRNAGGDASARPLRPSANADRPRRRPVEEDPYAPLGIRAGALTLWPAVGLSGGYDSNPERANVPRGSSLFVVTPELKVRTDWQRHAVAADIKGSYTTYGRTFDGSPRDLDRPSLDGKVVGRLDVSSHDRIDMEGRLLVGTDNPGSPNVQAGLQKLPIYTQFGTTLGYAHTFNRFELAAKAGIDRWAYESSLLTDGSSDSNRDRDYNQYSGGLRGSYTLLPGVKPFVEISADTRVHDLQFDRNKTQRDSDGMVLRGGTTFEFSRKLTGEISVGQLTRRYKDPTLPDISGLAFDSSLLWSATPLTTVTLTGKSTVDEVIVPGSSGVLRRDFAIQVDHAFRRWLTGTFRFGYGLDDYVGMDREDERWYASLAVLYKLNRNAQLKGELRRDWLTSTVPGADYTADAIMFGVRLQQ